VDAIDNPTFLTPGGLLMEVSLDGQRMTESEDRPFDQARNVAAISDASVLDGAPILMVVHYSEDHS